MYHRDRSGSLPGDRGHHHLVTRLIVGEPHQDGYVSSTSSVSFFSLADAAMAPASLLLHGTTHKTADATEGGAEDGAIHGGGGGGGVYGEGVPAMETIW